MYHAGNHRSEHWIYKVRWIPYSRASRKRQRSDLFCSVLIPKAEPTPSQFLPGPTRSYQLEPAASGGHHSISFPPGIPHSPGYPPVVRGWPFHLSRGLEALVAQIFVGIQLPSFLLVHVAGRANPVSRLLKHLRCSDARPMGFCPWEKGFPISNGCTSTYYVFTLAPMFNRFSR